jgi:predicted ATPase
MSPRSNENRCRVQSRASSVQKEAEECFWKAIKIARQQQAKSLELRAVMSLSRLWQQQGKIEEARQLLAEVYSWFTEGFNTKDLQEAKTLLPGTAGKRSAASFLSVEKCLLCWQKGHCAKAPFSSKEAPNK